MRYKLCVCVCVCACVCAFTCVCVCVCVCVMEGDRNTPGAFRSFPKYIVGDAGDAGDAQSAGAVHISAGIAGCRPFCRYGTRTCASQSPKLD